MILQITLFLRKIFNKDDDDTSGHPLFVHDLSITWIQKTSKIHAHYSYTIISPFRGQSSSTTQVNKESSTKYVFTYSNQYSIFFFVTIQSYIYDGGVSICLV